MYDLASLMFLIDMLILQCTVLLKKRNCFNILKTDIAYKHLIATENKGTFFENNSIITVKLFGDYVRI